MFAEGNSVSYMTKAAGESPCVFVYGSSISERPPGTPAAQPYGISVKFVEDWDLYHRLLGEVHCGSNADRAVTTKWWETGK